MQLIAILLILAVTFTTTFAEDVKAPLPSPVQAITSHTVPACEGECTYWRELTAVLATQRDAHVCAIEVAKLRELVKQLQQPHHSQEEKKQ